MGFCVHIILPPHYDLAAPTAGIPAFTPESKSDSFELLLQLDDISAPGLTEHVFQELFSKCRDCRKYMTRRTSNFHNCQHANAVEIIDLTNEN
jgi:hypothetical protein